MSFQIGPLEDRPNLHKIEINLIHSSVPLPTTTTQNGIVYTMFDNKYVIANKATSGPLDEPAVGEVMSASVQWSIAAYLYFIVLVILLA